MKTEALALPVGRRSRSLDYLALAKPRLNVLVILSTVTAYYLAAGRGVDLTILLSTILGTAAVAAGASAFNQILERDVDARMERTRLRPLPDGRLQTAEAGLFAWSMAVGGLATLAGGAGLLAAAVAFVTLSTYVLVYTPLKRYTPFSTVIGAVPGALPVLIGWAAARQSLDPLGWVLFGIVFFWQIPHFLAIAWMYRDDYAAAGIRLLPVVEPDGASTARQVLLYASALLPLTLLPTVLGLAGQIYLFGALLLSGTFWVLAGRFARERDLANARWLFFGSITYLPLLWGLMVANRIAVF